MKKTIHINGRFLSQPITGVQKFAWAICTELHATGVELVLLCPNRIMHKPSFGRVVHVGSLKGHSWEQIELPLYVKSHGIDELLNLCNTAPLLFSGNSLVIHDLAFMRNPEWFNPRFARWYKWLIPKLAKKAKRLLTVSEFSKSELVELLQVEKQNVHVIYNGIHWNREAKAVPLHISGKYILAVGSDDPRKNYAQLIRCFVQLNLQDVQLVIVGKRSKTFASNTAINHPQITWLNDVNDEQLQNLYQGAEVFISCSIYEGFGLPALEAISMNTKTILRDIPVYQELYGNICTFFDGSDHDLTQKIKKVIDTENIISLNPNILSSYSYKNSANKLLSLLEIA